MAGITAAENASNTAASTHPETAEQPDATPATNPETAWEQANKFASENFSDLNKYGSALVVVVLSIMLMYFA
jgi:hypothetical protein|eukprot:COSAG02_NODE_6541_length_3506_cov_3.733490_1_plen_72_part_00